jgi:hypothetical protein
MRSLLKARPCSMTRAHSRPWGREIRFATSAIESRWDQQLADSREQRIGRRSSGVSVMASIPATCDRLERSHTKSKSTPRDQYLGTISHWRYSCR